MAFQLKSHFFFSPLGAFLTHSLLFVFCSPDLSLRRCRGLQIRSVTGGEAISGNARLISSGIDPRRYLCITTTARTLHLQVPLPPLLSSSIPLPFFRPTHIRPPL